MDTAKKLLDDGKPREALERLKTLLPNVDAYNQWRVHELIGACFHDLADADGAAQAYFNAATTDKYLRSQRAHYSNYLFALHYLPQLDAPALTDALAVYNSLYRDVDNKGQGTWDKGQGVSLSVAYLSPNFCDSSAARFYEALLTDYDRDRFTVTAWSLSAEEDAFTKKIKRNVDAYTALAETSFFDAAQMIRDAGTDILIDLGGHTEGGETLQIAAYKPARVQLCGIGYFDSTGLDAIDYFIGDEYLTADDTTFAEKILLLANAFAFRPNARMIRERQARRPFPHRQFTFGNLNNFMKLSDAYLAAVKKILDALPDARIIFRDTTPLASRQIALIERLERFGLERFEVRRGSDDYFTDYAEIDLVLDAFPYSGGMMTALALYMGVPVLNLRGDLASTRTGADMLHIADVDDLIVTDVEAYVEKAVDLATNRRRPAALTAKINLDKLTDTKAFVEDFYARLEAI